MICSIKLLLSSIEWGTPDRFSFTSRYVHKFEKEKEKITWHNNLSVSLSPGISGGRLGVGYIGIYSPEVYRGEVAIIGELKTVLLRTWGNPLSTLPNNTFAGAEFSISFMWLCKLSVGYYTPVFDSQNITEAFYGFHIGVGI